MNRSENQKSLIEAISHISERNFKISPLYTKSPGSNDFVVHIMDSTENKAGEVEISRRLGSDTWNVQATTTHYFNGQNKTYFKQTGAKQYSDFDKAKEAWAKTIAEIVS